MFEDLYPGGPSIPFDINTGMLAETSAMLSFSSLCADWILADPARFEQFMAGSELRKLEGEDPDRYLTYDEARHLARLAEHIARHVAALAEKMREWQQQAAEEHEEQASQARTDDI